jgi:predicted nucleic acid-binding protein
MHAVPTGLPDTFSVAGSALMETAREKASQRIRDAADWPALALALMLESVIWMEDQGFCGTGVATWIAATAQRYLKS